MTVLDDRVKPSTPSARIQRWLATPVSRWLLLPVLVAAVLIGVPLGWSVSALGSAAQIRVGNTGGNLSVIITVEGRSIVVGGSQQRGELAELVDRGTLPWRRHVSLLVVPGWDDHYAPGALGLVERSTVEAIVVVGLPGADPIWTLLDRAAAERDIPINYLSTAHQLPLSDDTKLWFDPLTDEEGAGQGRVAVWLDHADVQLLLVDTTPQPRGTPPQPEPERGPAAVIQLRAGDLSISQPVSVLFRPEPQRGMDFRPAPAAYIGEITRGESLTIPLDRDRLRVPLDAITPLGMPSTPTPRSSD